MTEDGYHHGDLRRALLEGAIELLREQGIDTLTLRQLARRVAVSHAAPYHHFADKAALVDAVAEQGFRMLLRDLRGSLERAGDDACRQLQEAGVAYVAFAMVNSALFRVMFSAGRVGSLAASSVGPFAEGYALLIDVVRRCQAQGSLQPGDTEEMGRTAWALIHGLALLLLDGGFKPAGTDNREAAEALAREAMQRLAVGLTPGRGETPAAAAPPEPGR